MNSLAYWELIVELKEKQKKPQNNKKTKNKKNQPEILQE